MATHTIYIGVEDGRLVYWDQNGNPARAKHAKHQDSIRWQSKMRMEFTVEFVGEWPFEPPPVLLPSQGGATERKKVVVDPKSAVIYKYGVRAGELKDDPEIIIDPSE